MTYTSLIVQVYLLISRMCSFAAHLCIWAGAKKIAKVLKLIFAMEISEFEATIFILGLHLL